MYKVYFVNAGYLQAQIEGGIMSEFLFLIVFILIWTILIGYDPDPLDIFYQDTMWDKIRRFFKV